MIPTHDMLIHLWEQVAENGPLSEPHVLAIPGPSGVYTAAFADDEEHRSYIVAAEHVFTAENLDPPEWIAAMSPCHWLVTEDDHLGPGDAERQFAAGNPNAHESVAVSIATLDGPVRTIMYDQPLLEPSTDIMDDQGGHMPMLMTFLLVKMHTADED